jgi:hypothetical protein
MGPRGRVRKQALELVEERARRAEEGKNNRQRSSEEDCKSIQTDENEQNVPAGSDLLPSYRRSSSSRGRLTYFFLYFLGAGRPLPTLPTLFLRALTVSDAIDRSFLFFLSVVFCVDGRFLFPNRASAYDWTNSPPQRPFFCACTKVLRARFHDSAPGSIASSDCSWSTVAAVVHSRIGKRILHEEARNKTTARQQQDNNKTTGRLSRL